MGVVTGISSTTFPPHGRDEGQQVMLTSRWGIYPATIVRQDSVMPLNAIWKINHKHLPAKLIKGRDLYVSLAFTKDDQKQSPVCERGPLESRFVDIVFDHDMKNPCEGVCVTHRGNLIVFLITTGPHEGRYITSTECLYRERPAQTKEFINHQ